MTTKSKTGQAATPSPPGHNPDVIRCALEAHTLAQMVYGQLASHSPWPTAMPTMTGQPPVMGYTAPVGYEWPGSYYSPGPYGFQGPQFGGPVFYGCYDPRFPR